MLPLPPSAVATGGRAVGGGLRAAGRTEPEHPQHCDVAANLFEDIFGLSRIEIKGMCDFRERSALDFAAKVHLTAQSGFTGLRLWKAGTKQSVQNRAQLRVKPRTDSVHART